MGTIRKSHSTKVDLSTPFLKIGKREVRLYSSFLPHYLYFFNATEVQMAERHSCKVLDAGSSPVSGSSGYDVNGSMGDFQSLRLGSIPSIRIAHLQRIFRKIIFMYGNHLGLLTKS